MEVDHHAHSEGMCPPGLCENIFLAAPSFFRINPYAKAYGVKSEFLQQGSTFGFLSFSIVEFHPVLLHLGDPADVGSFCEGDIVYNGIYDFRLIVVLVDEVTCRHYD